MEQKEILACSPCVKDRKLAVKLETVGVILTFENDGVAQVENIMHLKYGNFLEF